MPKTNKTSDERERAVELVEAAMLHGAFRVSDIVRMVPSVRSRGAAAEYMRVVAERWSSQQRRTELNMERHRLIDQAREMIRLAWQDAGNAAVRPTRRLKAMRAIFDGHDLIARLLGLYTTKMQHSGNVVTDRNETIALLVESSKRSGVRESIAGMASD